MKTVDYYMELPYRMEIIPDKEEGGFIATFPDLPGCITVGDTIEAVIQNIVDAKRAWLEAELEIGAMIPEPKDFPNGGHNITKRSVYPIIISKEKDGFYVSIPDFEIATQGECIADAIMMARDGIGLMGIDMQDEGKSIPMPHSREYKKQKGDIVTLVDVDFAEYRKRVDVAPKDSFYSKENTESIKESMQQIRDGKIVQKTMGELEAMESE